MPRATVTIERLINAARSMAELAGQHEAMLAASGLAPDAIPKLEAAAEAYTRSSVSTPDPTPKAA